MRYIIHLKFPDIKGKRADLQLAAVNSFKSDTVNNKNIEILANEYKGQTSYVAVYVNLKNDIGDCLELLRILDVVEIIEPDYNDG